MILNSGPFLLQPRYSVGRRTHAYFASMSDFTETTLAPLKPDKWSLAACNSLSSWP